MSTRNDQPQATPERVQKLLAGAGLGSRREIEGWIREGRVRVNGEVAQLGDKASASDSITLDGKHIGKARLAETERRVIIYNKPEGELVTRKDPEGRKTVFEQLPKLRNGRWIPVGRLDINSAGLLLLTTDGELANRLMHPSQQIEREYAVRVHGLVEEDMLKTLVHGVELDDGPARFEEIVDSGGDGTNRWYHVVIMEGRNREVRRMWDAVGVQVNRLKRVRFGPIFMDSATRSGRWRDLNDEETKALLEMVGLKPSKPRRPNRSSKPRGKPAGRPNKPRLGLKKKR